MHDVACDICLSLPGGDEERSMHYDVLMAAEQRAVKGKKGLQNKEREAPTHHINDISGNAGKAKQFLPFLQRAGKSVVGPQIDSATVLITSLITCWPHR